MEAKNILSMVFLLVLCYSALSCGVPAHAASSSEHLSSQQDSARKMWNAAKMAHKRLLAPKRARREEASTPTEIPSPAQPSSPAPRYIMELFNNLTNATNEVAIDNANAIASANTIRSAPYSPPGECAARFCMCR